MTMTNVPSVPSGGAPPALTLHLLPAHSRVQAEDFRGASASTKARSANPADASYRQAEVPEMAASLSHMGQKSSKNADSPKTRGQAHCTLG